MRHTPVWSRTYRARPGYPDFVQDFGPKNGSVDWSVYITETQKTVARLHPVDADLINGLLRQHYDATEPAGRAVALAPSACVCLCVRACMRARARVCGWCVPQRITTRQRHPRRARTEHTNAISRTPAVDSLFGPASGQAQHTMTCVRDATVCGYICGG